MPKCIYCLKEDDDFTSEHVIPEAIGLYGTKTPVLDCVCNECNRYFGDNMEAPVFRKSIYNLARHEIMSEDKPVLRSNSKSRIIVSSEFLQIRYISEDILNGALLRINIDTKTLDFASQVGFKKRDGKREYEYYSDEVLKKDKELTKSLISKTKHLKDENKIFVYGGTDREHKRLCAFLYKQGVKFSKTCASIPLPESGKREYCAMLVFNEIFRRLLAKIAFNYFSYYVCPQLGKEYIFKPTFDRIRRYIRYGEKDDGHNFVRMRKLNMVFQEKEYRVSVIKTDLKGHLLAVNSTGGPITALVDLFHRTGFFVAEVLIGNPRIGISIHEGRCFDYKHGKISKMTSKYVFDRAGIVFSGMV